MQSNEIPVLPNKGRGLSGKMLVLPFEVSFEGKEDLDLEAELDRELEGIAAWCVMGAHRLENSRAAERWPVPAAAERAVHMYHLQNNPFDAFLEARFVQRKEGFVSNGIVRAQWEAWTKANKIRMHVANNMLPMKIAQGSSWGQQLENKSEEERDAVWKKFLTQCGANLTSPGLSVHSGALVRVLVFVHHMLIF
jgi:phage/plasmid-associated DNA primase